MSLYENIYRIGADRLLFPKRSPFQAIASINVARRKWRTRRRYRADLKRLLQVGPYMIEDVGLTLAEAEIEIEKPFWQAWRDP